MRIVTPAYAGVTMRHSLRDGLVLATPQDGEHQEQREAREGKGRFHEAYTTAHIGRFMP